MATHLPMYTQSSSLRQDGTRNFVHPADVSGRFTRLRYIVFAVLIGVYVALPWVHVGGHPAIFLDIVHRKFYLFGGTFNAQDFWLVFFLLTGVGFALVFLTAVLGRVWCGYACPQTVFLEGVYRRVERFIEGSRAVRMKRNAAPLTFDKVARKALKHSLFVLISVVVAHVFLSYFVSLPTLFQMVQRSPAEHPEAFVWTTAATGVMYFNFAWFREQLCLVICPYGRLQSALTDMDTIVVGYDQTRGEPRGKAKDASAGDCVDCGRCVHVCPTGIDIRNGLQIDCIGCAACIDACDDVMTKLKRPRGLIRYDSLNGLGGQRRRLLRPRIYFYVVLGVIGLSVAAFSWKQHAPFEANLFRLPGPPYVVENGEVRNSFDVHIVNKTDETEEFELRPILGAGLSYVLAVRTVRVASLSNAHIPVFVTSPVTATAATNEVVLEVLPKGEPGAKRVLRARFVGLR